MIVIDSVCKAYRTGNGWNQVLDNVSAVFPSGRNVGILGLNGSGKSTLLRMIGGSEVPDSGSITKDVRTSWPIGFSGGFQARLSGRENARFIARIYGADVETTMDFVAESSELGPYFDMPTGTYSSGMKARLAFSVSLAMKFECYLVDEVTAVGDRRFKAKYKQAFKELGKHATLIMVSHQTGTIRQFCDMAAVLHDGQLNVYDDLREGLAAYEEIAPERRQMRERPAVGRKRRIEARNS